MMIKQSIRFLKVPFENLLKNYTDLKLDALKAFDDYIV